MNIEEKIRGRNAFAFKTARLVGGDSSTCPHLCEILINYTFNGTPTIRDITLQPANETYVAKRMKCRSFFQINVKMVPSKYNRIHVLLYFNSSVYYKYDFTPPWSVHPHFDVKQIAQSLRIRSGIQSPYNANGGMPMRKTYGMFITCS